MEPYSVAAPTFFAPPPFLVVFPLMVVAANFTFLSFTYRSQRALISLYRE